MIKPITSVKVANRRVIVRAGFDVPLKNGKVADDTRIQDGIKTLKYLIEGKAKIIVMAKLGRPEGWDENFSSWPAAEKLGELLNYKVVKVSDRLPDYKVPQIYFLASDITKKDYSDFSQQIAPGSILYLENLFFYPGEQEEDEKFVKILAKYGEIYVDEAFASAHHGAASNVGLAKAMPGYGGVQLMAEINGLGRAMKNPKKPFVLMMGGAKIAEKVETIKNLAPNADAILIGGGLSNTFFKALGYEIGQSIFSDPQIAKELLRNFRDKIVLPKDIVVAKSPDDKASCKKPEKILKNEMILDIGPETIRLFAEHIKKGKTLVWNGPMGLFEKPQFAFGTMSLARIFAARSKGVAYGIIGGGETIEAVDQAKVAEFIDHVSMGGGAMLEFLAGKKLPGIKVLEHK